MAILKLGSQKGGLTDPYPVIRKDPTIPRYFTGDLVYYMGSGGDAYVVETMYDPPAQEKKLDGWYVDMAFPQVEVSLINKPKPNWIVGADSLIAGELIFIASANFLEEARVKNTSPHEIRVIRTKRLIVQAIRNATKGLFSRIRLDEDLDWQVFNVLCARFNLFGVKAPVFAYGNRVFEMKFYKKDWNEFDIRLIGDLPLVPVGDLDATISLAAAKANAETEPPALSGTNFPNDPEFIPEEEMAAVLAADTK